MVRAKNPYGFPVLLVIIALGLFVYRMNLTAGKSLNTPAIAGGVLIHLAITVLAVKISLLQQPAH